MFCECKVGSMHLLDRVEEAEQLEEGVHGPGEELGESGSQQGNGAVGTVAMLLERSGGREEFVISVSLVEDALLEERVAETEARGFLPEPCQGFQGFAANCWLGVSVACQQNVDAALVSTPLEHAGNIRADGKRQAVVVYHVAQSSTDSVAVRGATVNSSAANAGIC